MFLREFARTTAILHCFFSILCLSVRPCVRTDGRRALAKGKIPQFVCPASGRGVGNSNAACHSNDSDAGTMTWVFENAERQRIEIRSLYQKHVGTSLNHKHQSKIDKKKRNYQHQWSPKKRIQFYVGNFVDFSHACRKNLECAILFSKSTFRHKISACFNLNLAMPLVTAIIPNEAVKNHIVYRYFTPLQDDVWDLSYRHEQSVQLERELSQLEWTGAFGLSHNVWVCQSSFLLLRISQWVLSNNSLCEYPSHKATGTLHQRFFHRFRFFHRLRCSTAC